MKTVGHAEFEFVTKIEAIDFAISVAGLLPSGPVFDLDRALEAQTTIDDDVAKHREFLPAGPVHEGAVWFNFVTGVEGAERRVRGRIVFATTPYGVDGTLGHMVTESQALVWRDGELAPHWQHIPEEMLPVELVAAAYDEIDALATAKAIAAKSNA